MNQLNKSPRPENTSSEGQGDVLYSILAPSQGSPPKTNGKKTTHCRPDQTPWWMRWLEGAAWLAVIAYALFSYLQLGAMIKSADAAKSAADTAHDSLVLSERPWVYAPAIKFVEPIVFDPLKQTGVTAISFTLKNTGHSPALHVNWRSKLIPLTVDGSTREILQKQSDLCEPMRQEKTSALEMTIFPGTEQPFRSWGEALYPADIQDGLKAHSKTGYAPHEGYISLALIACIDYRMSFSTDHHQTRYAFFVGIPKANGKALIGDIRPEGSVPVEVMYVSTSAD